VFEGAEIGGFALKAVIDRRERRAGIDGFGAGFQAEIEVHGVIDVVAAGVIGGRHFFEDVEVDFDAVLQAAMKTEAAA
jgi:hypothetical protein